MKGNLIFNTLAVAGVLIFYYLTLVMTNYMFSIWDTIPILSSWKTSWDPNTKIFWDFIVYFGIPLIIIIAFITHTKPKSEVITLRRF